MTVLQGETRETTAQIIRLVWANSKDGAPQWEVQLRWDWTPVANKGGDKTWVAQSDFPQWTAATKGAVNLEVAAGYIKKAAEGKEPFDGHLDWMWHWYVRKVLDHAPVVNAQQPGAPAAQGSAEPRTVDQRIAWNSAINNATNLLAAMNPKELVPGDSYHDWILTEAAWYYATIAAGPPSNPVEAPVAPADVGAITVKYDGGLPRVDKQFANPSWTSEETQTPPPAPHGRPSYEALQAVNQARIRVLDRGGWATEQGSLTWLEQYTQAMFGGRVLRQLTDAELGQVTAAIDAVQEDELPF